MSINTERPSNKTFQANFWSLETGFTLKTSWEDDRPLIHDDGSDRNIFFIAPKLQQRGIVFNNGKLVTMERV